MMWFLRDRKAASASINRSPRREFPIRGDAFRSISFGMTEKEYQFSMKRDKDVDADLSRSYPIFGYDMFGSEFIFNPKYMDGKLFSITLISEPYSGYSSQIRALFEAVLGMFIEKYGEPAQLYKVTQRYAGSKVWDFRGKTIEVALVSNMKHGQSVAIEITSTAMIAAHDALITSKNKEKFGKYSANF